MDRNAMTRSVPRMTSRIGAVAPSCDQAPCHRHGIALLLVLATTVIVVSGVMVIHLHLHRSARAEHEALEDIQDRVLLQMLEPLIHSWLLDQGGGMISNPEQPYAGVTIIDDQSPSGHEPSYRVTVRVFDAWAGLPAQLAAPGAALAGCRPVAWSAVELPGISANDSLAFYDLLHRISIPAGLRRYPGSETEAGPADDPPPLALWLSPPGTTVINCNTAAPNLLRAVADRLALGDISPILAARRTGRRHRLAAAAPAHSGVRLVDATASWHVLIAITQQHRHRTFWSRYQRDDEQIIRLFRHAIDGRSGPDQRPPDLGSTP